MIPPHEIRYGSFGGKVRFSGKLSLLDCRNDAASEAATLETIEVETRRIPGVRSVQFDLSNWRRSEFGQWEQMEGGLRRKQRRRPSAR